MDPIAFQTHTCYFRNNVMVNALGVKKNLPSMLKVRVASHRTYVEESILHMEFKCS